jgi:hypothetical protein
MSSSRRVTTLVVLSAFALATLAFIAPEAFAANVLKYPCQTSFGSVLIPASAWAGSLSNTGHDGATFTVYSNYLNGSCARPVGNSPSNQWGYEYQCTELAVRVADAEWAVGNWAAWKNAGWTSGAADAMRAPGQKLGLTWTANGAGSLPAPGDLMIWSSSGGADPGHVGVVSAVTSSSVTFVGENQADGMVTLPVSGTTVEDNGWKGSSIVGWLSHPQPKPNYVYHVFDGTSSGALDESYWGGGNTLTTWQPANVGSPVTSIAAARTPDGVLHVFAGTSSGAIYESYWGGGNTLTTYQLVNVGSPVTSIQFADTPDGVYHVFDGTSSGTIHETYWGGGNTKTTWQIANVGSPVTSIQFLVTS